MPGSVIPTKDQGVLASVVSLPVGATTPITEAVLNEAKTHLLENEPDAVEMLYAISELIVFLALAALYESLMVPLAVILAVPFSFTGARKLHWQDNPISPTTSRRVFPRVRGRAVFPAFPGDA